jgi:hypothetical protein
VEVVEPFEQAFPDGPPADPEEWTDDQWLAWLRATDGDADGEGGHGPVTTAGRITHSSGGQVLGSAMLGMANAIYGRHDDEVVIVAEGDASPDGEEPFRVHLDPDHPERSSVIFREPLDPPR